MRKFAVLCATFWWMLPLSWAQDPAYLKLNIQKTMPSNTVYDLCEDKRGFIWLATEAGVYRYDGFQFKGFQSDSLLTGGCSALALDAEGDVWFENFDGYVFQIRHDTLHRLALKRPPINYIPFGLVGPYLLLPTRGGIDVYDSRSRQWSRFLSYTYQTVISASTDDQVYHFLSSEGLLQVNSSLQLNQLPYKQELSNRSILSLACDSGTYLMYKYNELKRLSLLHKSGDLSHLPFMDGQFIQGIHHTGGQVWVTTNEGAWLLKNNQWKGPFWKEHSISDIYQDTRGLLWISTLNEGVLVVPDFNHLYASFAPQSLYSMCATTQGYLLGTGNGLILQTNSFLQESRLFAETGLSKPVFGLQLDGSTSTIMALGNGLQLFDQQSGQLKSSMNIGLKALKRINERQLAYAGSSEVGLMSWPAASGSSKQTLQTTSLLYEVRGKAVAVRQDTLYYATSAALLAYHSGNFQPILAKGQALVCKELHVFQGELLAVSTLGNRYRIQGLHAIPDQRWGLGHLPALKMTTYQNKLAMLSTDQLYILQEDEVKKEVKIQSFSLYRPAEDISALLLEKDRALLLDRNGVTIVSLSSPTKSLAKPTFLLEAILSNSRALDQDKPSTLDYSENTLELRYALLSYGLAADPALYYSLNAQPWSKAPPQSRTLRLAALAPGNYTLRFSYDANGATILYESPEIRIQKPFWQRTEVLVLSLFSLVFIVFGYFQLQLNRFKEKNKALTEKIALEKELSHSTLTALRSQMNPHFFFNALNTIQAYIFQNDKHQAANYLAKFSKLTRMILEQSAVEKHPLSEEITALTLYLELEKMRFNEDFNFSITVENSITPELILVPAMLIQPYVENAVKHGLLHAKGEKIIEIVFKTQDQNLIVLINDNGVGRKKAMELRQQRAPEHRSFATQATDRRLSVLNAGRKNPLTVDITDKIDDQYRPVGTLVKITLPLPLFPYA